MVEDLCFSLINSSFERGYLLGDKEVNGDKGDKDI